MKTIKDPAGSFASANSNVLNLLTITILCLLSCCLISSVPGQSVLNIDFGVGEISRKAGLAAAGNSTNDFWNLYRHYAPRFASGMHLVPDGKQADLRMADGTPTEVVVGVTNAPGVWGNATGDAMYDTYIYSSNGKPMLVVLENLGPGRYHFYVYGHADSDVTGEQNSVLTLRSGTNLLGPLATVGSAGWNRGNPWQNGCVVFRDVEVGLTGSVELEVSAAANGVPVLNGLQVISRGTAPPRLLTPPAPQTAVEVTNLVVRSVSYDGRLSDSEARFEVTLQVESRSTNEVTLFQGEVALLVETLPEGLRIVSGPGGYQLRADRPGEFEIRLELVAKITRGDEWNQIAFRGPPAAIASIQATAQTEGVEIELLSGAELETDTASTVTGFLGADRQVALRWQGKTAEVRRQPLITVETSASIQIVPTVITYDTRLRYEILQAEVAQLEIGLPRGHGLTRVRGEHIRDWHLGGAEHAPRLVIDFIKPVLRSYELTLLTEQPMERATHRVDLQLPHPRHVERETGSLLLKVEDVRVEVESTEGLQQVNASEAALAAYQFHSRPFGLVAKLSPIEPEVRVSDRVTARLEETRLMVSHQLMLDVSKVGIYDLELEPQAGFAVIAVLGEGVEHWEIKQAEGKAVLAVGFANRILGDHPLLIQLEQPQKSFPKQVTIDHLSVVGATNQTAQIGVASAPGIRLKTAGTATGLRELPVAELVSRSNELLAFAADGAPWSLILDAEQLTARAVAQVFNLITVGDGLVGGSATLRFGLFDQGLQDFQLRLPAHWKNVDFIGANIRRKELDGSSLGSTNEAIWNLTLQDKAWGGYTLVITYDYQFDPNQDTLDLRGAHVVGAERETGSLAVTTASGLALTPAPATEPLRLIDPVELAPADRVLITHPVLMAYRYQGAGYELSAVVTRHKELRILDAVADRTEITSVLTLEGQMLTQASFMVKNNDKQFQRFQLPDGASLWGCYVDSQPVKAEQDEEWLLVSLPRGGNRERPFGVDIVYKQTFAPLKGGLVPRTLAVSAPKTDVPNTYAEWQLFVPEDQRLSAFAGSMRVAPGTVYDWRVAGLEFVGFYSRLLRKAGVGLGLIAGLGLLLVTLFIVGKRRGWDCVVSVLIVFAVLALLAGMLLPALSKAKARAQRINAVSNLKQIGLAARMFANDHGRFPDSFEEMMAELVSDKVLVDPSSGKRFIYVGAGKSEQHPQAILAYSPDSFLVCLADGSAQQLTPARFAEALHLDAVAQSRAAAQQIQAHQGQSVLNQQAIDLVSSNVVLGDLGLAEGVDSTGVVGGLRSIRIDLPKTGRAIKFTKMLNVDGGALSIQMRAMRENVYKTTRSLLQALSFVVGLWLIVRTRQQARPGAFSLTVGIFLAAGAVLSLMISLRGLHIALIWSVPVTILVSAAHLLRRYWSLISPPPVRTESGFSPPATTGLLLILSASLLTTAGNAAPQETNMHRISIISASYQGTIGVKVARIQADLLLHASKSGLTIPLFGEQVAVESFESDVETTRLRREEDQLAVYWEGQGEARLRFKLAVRLGGDATQRSLSFVLPPALSSRVELTLPEPDADVEFPSAISLERINEPDQTRVKAILGAGAQVDMQWTPRVKRVTEMEASVFSHGETLVRVGAGVVNTRSIIGYRIVQGELRRARVLIPLDQRLLKVDGDWVRTWQLSEEPGHQVLNVELLKGVTSSWQLQLVTESPLGSARLNIEVPQTVGVIRASGLLGLQGAQETGVTVISASGLQRVDPDEFASGWNNGVEGLVYRFSDHEFQLRVNADPVKPHIEAVAYHGIRLGFGLTRVAGQVDYTIKEAGIFSLRLELPDGYRVDSVTGTHLQQWHVKGEPPILEIALKERVQGAFTLHYVLTRSYPSLPPRFQAAGAHPLGVAELSGYLAVTAEPGIGLKTGPFEGLTEVPPSTLPDTSAFSRASGTPSEGDRIASGPLAFNFNQAQDTGSWTLTVLTEELDSWARVEVANFVSVSETLISGRALLRYDIQNAPRQELRLHVPAGFRNVELAGPNIRRRDAVDTEWRVELQSKVDGIYLLTVAWEQPRSQSSNALHLEGVRAIGADRETGFVAVLARPPLQVLPEGGSEGLVRIDAQELPAWTRGGFGGEAPVLVFRYLRPGWQMDLEVKRFRDVQVLQGLIDSAKLATVVADDGQMMTEMRLAVRNNGLQHLQLELPPGSTVWSAFVAGQPVRPARDQNQLKLPLEGSSSAKGPLSVELTFVTAAGFPSRRGTVRLSSPQLDMPLKDARWDIFLPPEYDYAKFCGSMTYETTAAPEVKVYSQTEYAKQEERQQTVIQHKLEGFMRNARHLLAEGKLKVANDELNQALRLTARHDHPAGSELEALKQEISRAQSSNLLDAQRAYTDTNAVLFGTSEDGLNDSVEAQVLSRSGQYDARTAEQQWQALEKAQAVTLAPVQPLRVNLPTRGVHHAFTQVLQTEAGQPMTVQFKATRIGGSGWLRKSLLLAASFLMLWLGVFAAVTVRRLRQEVP